MAKRRGVTVDTARRLVMSFPGTDEGRCLGTDGFRVRGMILARFRDDDSVLVVKCGDTERDLRIRSDPLAFFITDDYRGHPSVLIRLDSVREADLRDVLEVAWLRIASQRLRASYVLAKRR